MNYPICEPLEEAETQDVIRSGLGITDLRATRGTVFTYVPNPSAWLLPRLRPVRSAYGSPAKSAYDTYRESLPLAPIHTAFALGWPLDVRLEPGVLLDSDKLPRWEAERAVEGLLAGEPRYIELASGLLVDSKGCILDLPGDMSAVLVRDEDFAGCINIREPVLLFGGQESDVSQSA
jgi:hypothetical protein